MRKIVLLVLVAFLLTAPAASTNDSVIKVSVNETCGSDMIMLSGDGREVEREDSIGFFNSIENDGNLKTSFKIDSWITNETRKDFGSGHGIKEFPTTEIQVEPNRNILHVEDFSVPFDLELGSHMYRSDIEASCSTTSYYNRTRPKDVIGSLYSCNTGQESFRCKRSFMDDGWDLNYSLSCKSINSTHASCELHKEFFKRSEVSQRFTVGPDVTVIEPKEKETVLDAGMWLEEDLLDAKRGKWEEIGVDVENTGDESLEDLEVRAGYINSSRWSVRSSRIENLSVDGLKTRNIYIRPSEDLEIRNYSVPVELVLNGTVMDTKYLDLEVKERVFDPSIEIVSSVGEQVLRKEEVKEIELKIRNTGNLSFEDPDASLQNFGSCGEYEVRGLSGKVSPGELTTAILVLEAGDRSSRCSTLFTTGSEGAYDFERIPVLVLPQAGLIASSPCWFPLLIWTVLTASFIVMRRDREFKSGRSQLVFLTVIEIWGLIFLYTLLNCYYPGLSPLFPSLV